MKIPFLFGHDRKSRHVPRGLRLDLPPHMMRDIGLPAWPVPPRLPFYPLW